MTKSNKFNITDIIVAIALGFVWGALLISPLNFKPPNDLIFVSLIASIPFIYYIIKK